MKETINIALGFDKVFSKYASITIKSILCNNKSKLRFHLMVDKSVPLFDKIYIQAMIKLANQDVHFYDMTNSFQNSFVGNWSSKAIYYPILLSSICKEDRVIFFDSDIIVNTDLSGLYNTDISGLYCAAVYDYGMNALIKMKELANISDKKVITVDEYFAKIRKWDSNDMNRYFNSGMLLLNLKEMRSCNAEEKLLNIIKEELLLCPDQDCFNICFHDKVKILPISYNFMVSQDSVYPNLLENDKKLYDDIVLNNKTPLIIHFLNKPWWNPNKIHFEDLFLKYKDKTIWKFKISKKKRLRLKFSASESYMYIFGHKVFHTILQNKGEE